LIVVRTHAENARQPGNCLVATLLRRRFHRRYIFALTCKYPAAGRVTLPYGQRRGRAGDHLIVLLEIVSVREFPSAEPLVFHQSRFRELREEETR
jgi:hypothetical protein